MRDGRFWVRGPRQGDGRRKSIGFAATREEAEELLAPKPKPSAQQGASWQMGVVENVAFDWWDPADTKRFFEQRDRRETAERATRIPTSPAANAAWRLQHEREYRLLRHLDGWRRAKEIRAYVAEVNRLLEEFNCEPDPDASELPAWLAWCEEHASRLDPFTEMRQAMAKVNVAD